MRSFDFLRKNKKVVVKVGLLLVCVSIAFSACAVGKMPEDNPMNLLRK